jgi:hypothetical protein
MAGENGKIEEQKKKWGTGFLAMVLIPCIAVYLTYGYNKSQVEVARVKIMAEILPRITSDNIGHGERRALAVSLTVLQEAAIPLLISLLDNNDDSTREAAANALGIIGSESLSMLKGFLLSDFVWAKHKGEAIIVLEQIDKRESKSIREQLVRRMLKHERPLGQDIDFETDSFIHPKTVLSLYRLNTDLSNTYLPRIDLRNKNLNGILLSGAILTHAKLQGSQLRNATFDDAHLEDTNLDGADVYKAKFRDAISIRTRFSGMYNLKSSDWAGATIKDPIGARMEEFGR